MYIHSTYMYILHTYTLYIYIHTYVHTYINTYMYIHTYTHTHIHTNIHTYIYTYIYTYIRTYIYTNTLTTLLTTFPHSLKLFSRSLRSKTYNILKIANTKYLTTSFKQSFTLIDIISREVIFTHELLITQQRGKSTSKTKKSCYTH